MLLARGILAHAGLRGHFAAFLMIAAALLEGVGLLLLIPILNVIMAGPIDGPPGAALTWIGIDTADGQLLTLLAGFVLAALARAQVIHMRDIAIAKIQLGFVRAERNEIIERLVNASWETLVSISHSRVQSLVTNDIVQAAAAAQLLLRIVVLSLIVSVNAVIALVLATDLVLLVAAFLGLGAAFLWFTQREVFALGRQVRGSAQHVIGNTQDLLMGLKTALAQESQAWFKREFARVQDWVRDSQLAFRTNQSNSRRFFGAVSSIAAAGVVLGGYLLSVPPASLLVVVVIFARLAGPILQLQQTTQQFLYALPSYVAILDMRELLPPANPPNSDDTVLAEADLVLDKVVYRYAEESGVGPLSLNIRYGEFIGIEGPSGAGKSTLVDILAGLLKPQAGHMYLGAVKLDGAASAALRRNLSYLGQQTCLFDDTLRANLCWTEERLPEEDIWQKLEFVGLADVVRRLPHGLDTRLGEQGAMFSGGERQRIALARALLRRPAFLILDEATNAIDVELELALLERLSGMPDRPTIVMVAHRQESLVRCDRVITIERGLICNERAGELR